VIGEDDRSIANLLDAFGESVRLNGKQADAEVILREGLAIRRRLFGNEDRDMVHPLFSLAVALLDQRKLVEAEAIAREGLALRSKFPGTEAGRITSTLGALGAILLQEGKFAEAESVVRKGAEMGSAWCQSTLAWMYRDGLGMPKDLAESAKWCRKAAEGRHPSSQFAMGQMYATGEGVTKDTTEAAKWYAMALESNPPKGLNRQGWILATHANSDQRDGVYAVKFAEKAVAMTRRKEPNFLDTLAAAYAEVGNFEKAIIVQQEAITLLKDEEQKKDYASRLKLYESRSPYRTAE
jgi:TPR repeat protein